jgi:hypothetical protein
VRHHQGSSVVMREFRCCCCSIQKYARAHTKHRSSQLQLHVPCAPQRFPCCCPKPQSRGLPFELCHQLKSPDITTTRMIHVGSSSIPLLLFIHYMAATCDASYVVIQRAQLLPCNMKVQRAAREVLDKCCHIMICCSSDQARHA